MIIFSPALARAAALLDFPRPVLTCRLLDAWDFEQMKVPLQNGDLLQGHSRQGVDIQLEGQIGSHSGALKLSEPEMLASLQTLRNWLSVDQSQGEYALVLFRDAAGTDHRFFKRCSTVRFECDLSNQHLYSYSATIHAADPQLYEGALSLD